MWFGPGGVKGATGPPAEAWYGLPTEMMHRDHPRIIDTGFEGLLVSPLVETYRVFGTSGRGASATFGTHGTSPTDLQRRWELE